MQAYRVKTTLQKDGTLTLHRLPFQAGESVEVIILPRSSAPESSNRCALRGTPVQYLEPTKPVAQEDWDAIQ